MVVSGQLHTPSAYRGTTHPSHNHSNDFAIQACPDDVQMTRMAVGWESES